jgi:glycerophosphoryl diester phosphodiesterase
MRQLCFLLSICLFFSCQALIDAPVPNLYWDKFEAPGAKELPPQTYTKLEGVYKISIADDDFGDSAVVKWTYDIQGTDTTNYLSIFCNEDVRYFILQGRSSGDSILLNGYWRNIENTKTGKAQFIISNRHGGFALVTGAAATSPLILKGFYGMFGDSPHKGVNFQFDRPLKTPPPFQIIAHRGGGRNNDLLPASENSLEMIHLASRLGANGIEIDVQITKDGVPVLFHDANLNDRLTQKTGIHGSIDEYTYQELQQKVNLKRGGKIPTLQDALHTVLYNTPLRFVWLDCKTFGPINSIHALQKDYIARAKATGRDMEIMLGVPDETVMKHFLSLPGHQNIPSICELEQESALKMDASVWATSWTKGLQLPEVAAAQQKGMRTFVWTLDVPRKIKQFMREGRFNGIVTNRPTAVAFEHYQQK